VASMAVTFHAREPGACGKTLNIQITDAESLLGVVDQMGTGGSERERWHGRKGPHKSVTGSSQQSGKLSFPSLSLFKLARYRREIKTAPCSDCYRDPCTDSRCEHFNETNCGFVSPFLQGIGGLGFGTHPRTRPSFPLRPSIFGGGNPRTL
jgi:hypothetical protein